MDSQSLSTSTFHKQFGNKYAYNHYRANHAPYSWQSSWHSRNPASGHRIACKKGWSRTRKAVSFALVAVYNHLQRKLKRRSTAETDDESG